MAKRTPKSSKAQVELHLPAAPERFQEVKFLDILKLDHLWSVKQSVETLAQKLKKLNEEYALEEAEIIQLLREEGYKNDPKCPYVVAVEVDKRSNIKWKEEFIKRLGEAAAKKIIAETPKKETPYLVLTKC